MIKLFGCSYDEFDAEFKQEHPFHHDVNDKSTHGIFTKYEFNLTSGESKITILKETETFSCDFPVFNLSHTGYKSRYVYLSHISKDIPESQDEKNNMHFKGFIKFDLDEEKIVGHV